MYVPGSLWTAAKHKIPLLAVMHNNRGYHQEVMHVQRLSNFRNRVANLGGDMGPVGTSIEQPDIEYHKLAEVDGLVGERPDQGSGPARPCDQGSGRPGQGRPARAGQRLDPAALSINVNRRMPWTKRLALRRGMPQGDFADAFCSYAWGRGRRRRPRVQSSRRARGIRREGQGSLRPARLLGLPWLPGAGRHHRPEARARSACRTRRSTAFVRTTNRTMPPYMEAILSNEDLADIHAYLLTHSEAGGLQVHSAAQSVAVRRQPTSARTLRTLILRRREAPSRRMRHSA